MDEKLEKLNDHMYDLIKYAEAKNGLIVGFNVVILLEIFPYISIHPESIDKWGLLIFSYIFLCNFISLIIGVYSFLPRHQTQIIKHQFKNQTNHLYYGTIATLNPNEYFEQIHKKYELKPISKEYCFDIIRQLIIQSQILVNKFNCFSLAATFTTCAFITPLGFFIFKWLYNKHFIYYG